MKITELIQKLEHARELFQDDVEVKIVDVAYTNLGLIDKIVSDTWEQKVWIKLSDEKGE